MIRRLITLAKVKSVFHRSKLFLRKCKVNELIINILYIVLNAKKQ